MKHSVSMTVVLLAFFVVSQLIGVFLLSASMDVKVDSAGVQSVEFKETILGSRPEMEPKTSFFSIVSAIIVGTLIVLLIMRLNLVRVWKVWFFLAVSSALSVAFGVVLPTGVAVVCAVVLAFFKVFRPGVVVQNLAELFIYSGIAVLFVPLLNVFWMGLLLVVVSLYDAYAVWKSRHMISMAKFQSGSKTFAGVFIPYKKAVGAKETEKSAILGGGDIAFPMLFAGVVMSDFIARGLSLPDAVIRALSVVLFSSLALALLFIRGKEDRFYPAMPFLSLGCALGYVFALLL